MEKNTENLVGWTAVGKVMVGLDVGDKKSHWTALDDGTGELRTGWVESTPAAVEEWLRGGPRCRVVLESGTHSYWMARLVKRLGHEAIVVPADALAGRKRRRKNDPIDSGLLMELGRDAERKRIAVVWQRGEADQRDLALMRARDTAVRMRSRLVSSIRGLVKQFGERVKAHDLRAFPEYARQELSAELVALVEPSLKMIEAANEQIRAYDRAVDEHLKRRDKEAEQLMEVNGVGPMLTGATIAFVGEAKRFSRNRDGASAVGLVPRLAESGESSPQLGISKAGNELVRRYAVQASQYILSARGTDCDLRRWGLKLVGESPNKTRKRKAVIAVARKLVTLLVMLLRTGAVYDPFYHSKQLVKETEAGAVAA